MVLKPNAVVDIAKPGPQLQNLTGMWNARVLDGFTPFVVQFKENGLPVNLTNLTAFIEGDIGEGHYDSATDDVVMTGTPKSVRYTDDGSGNTNMGIVVFRLPPQFFIQTGIFKGFIGLQSSTGIRSTSNDVWFKVLGNSYTMGISCKYFISDFQKALDTANGKIDKALQDLYEKYNAKAGKSETDLGNILSAMKQIEATQQNLNIRLTNTKQQIDSNDVVTRSEYDKLANEIVNRLGQINTKPDYYDNYNDMLAANPNGTQNLCVTSDTQHKWLFVNGSWLDLGEFSYADIAPALKNSLYSQEHENVLVNPDMKNGAYGWNVISPWVANSDNNIDNSQSYGIYVQNIPANTAYEIFQDPIPVYKHKVLSAGVKVWTNNAESALIQILFRDANHNIIDNAISRKSIPANIPEWRTIKLENISIPDNAVSAAFTISMLGKGVLNICQPQVNFEPSLYPYSIKEVQDSLTEMQENESHKLPYFTFNTDAANVNDKWITAPFAYNDGLRVIKGYAQIAIQGDSSRGYPKKNYKIKLFSDSDCKQKLKVKMKANWASLANFNLKANWIDATQSRNLVGAKLMADATAVTPFQDDKVAENLSKSQAYGQMEGFPIEVWFGTDYHGLYSCNTKKVDSSFGMDKDTQGTAVVSVLDNVKSPSSQLLRVPTAKLDNVAYADELHDTPDPDLATNWSAWLDFVNNSSDTDFKAKLSNYIDINSAINLYLFGVMSREYDYESKSVLYLTWDNGKSYYLVAYDLDSNWGQNVSGEIEGNPQDDKWGFSTKTSSHKDGSFVDNAGMNKLFERIFKLFKPEIKAQYLKLRNSVWRTDQIIKSYKDYLEEIPEALLERDQAKWPQIPSIKNNNFEQLHQIITQRCNQMDKWIDQFDSTAK